MSNQSTNKNPSLKLTRTIRDSGFLAVHSPYDFQTLIALCTFADCKGRLKMSSKTLAQTLNLCEKQAQARITRLLNLRFKGKPLMMRDSHHQFTPNQYCLILPDGFQLILE